jgi:hypothetical protein
MRQKGFQVVPDFIPYSAKEVQALFFRALKSSWVFKRTMNVFRVTGKHRATLPRTTTTETAKRPPGLSTRKASFEHTLLGYTSLWLAIAADTGATLIVTTNALRFLR